MFVKPVVLLALLLQGVCSRPQDDASRNGVTVSLEGSASGSSSIANVIRHGSGALQHAVGIPLEIMNAGVDGAQMGFDVFKQLLSSLIGNGSIKMSMPQASVLNFIQANNDKNKLVTAMEQESDSANQVISVLMDIFSLPDMRKKMDEYGMTLGDDMKLVVDFTKMPEDYAAQLQSMFGVTAENKSVTIDFTQPQYWNMLTSIMQRALPLAGDNTVSIGLTQPDIGLRQGALSGINTQSQFLSGQGRGEGGSGRLSVDITQTGSGGVSRQGNYQGGSLTLTSPNGLLEGMLQNGIGLLNEGVNFVGQGMENARQIIFGRPSIRMPMFSVSTRI